MQVFDIRVRGRNGTRAFKFPIRELVIAGWTGRNESDVQRHIKELEAIGIQAPNETPIFYRVARGMLTSAGDIEVLGPDTSGEAECVLFIDDGEVYVAVGSDHTDRKLESVSVSQSKQICAKPVSVDAWCMSEVIDHWDELHLESRIGAGFATQYQSGAVSGLRNPDELLRIYRSRGGDIGPGTVVFCGTLPVIGGIRYSEALQLKLVDPILGREIEHSYRTTVLPILG